MKQILKKTIICLTLLSLALVTEEQLPGKTQTAYAASQNTIPNKPKVIKSGSGYKVDTNVFSLTLPQVWRNANFNVKLSYGGSKKNPMSDFYYTFTDLNNKSKGGVVFVVLASPEYPDMVDNAHYIGKRGKRKFFLYQYTDVEYDYNNSKRKKSYETLAGTIPQIVKSMKIK